MPSVRGLVTAMRRSPTSVSFADLEKVCEHYFGKPRHEGSSHKVYKMPWSGDPRVNTQSDKGMGEGIPGEAGTGGHREDHRRKSERCSALHLPGQLVG